MNRRKFLIGSAVVPLVAVLPAVSSTDRFCTVHPAKINYDPYYDSYNRNAKVIGSPVRYIYKDRQWVRSIPNTPSYLIDPAEWRLPQ